MRTVSSREVAIDEASVSGLPERVQDALGELAGAAKEGLLALSVGVGLGVGGAPRPRRRRGDAWRAARAGRAAAGPRGQRLG